ALLLAEVGFCLGFALHSLQQVARLIVRPELQGFFQCRNSFVVVIILIVGVSEQQKRVCRLWADPRGLLRAKKRFSGLAQLEQNGSVVLQQDAVIWQEHQRRLEITRSSGVVEPLFLKVGGNGIGGSGAQRVAFLLNSFDRRAIYRAVANHARDDISRTGHFLVRRRRFRGAGGPRWRRPINRPLFNAD